MENERLTKFKKFEENIYNVKNLQCYLETLSTP